MYFHSINEFVPVEYKIKLTYICNELYFEFNDKFIDVISNFRNNNELEFLIFKTDISKILNSMELITQTLLNGEIDSRRVKKSLMQDIGDKKYSMYSNSSQLLHIDGASKNCPQFVLMGVLDKSNLGGESILVQSKLVFDYFYEKYGNKILEDSELTVEGMLQNSNSIKHKVNLFEIENGLKKMYHITTIPRVSGSKFAIELYKEAIEFVQNQNNQTRFVLEIGEILVLKNTQVLHARNGFEKGSKRAIQRHWVF